MILLAFILVLISLVAIYIHRHFTYWKRQGVKGYNFIMLNLFFEEHHETTYRELKRFGRIYGGYRTFGKFLVINEPELIKDVFIKNFHIFPDHQHFHIGTTDKVNKMLFFMPGDQDWKRVRSIVSPAYTSGKLKAMMSHISDISDKFITNLEHLEKRGEVIDMRQHIGAFAMDVISACAYGINIDSVNNPNHPVVQNAKRFFGVNANLSMIISITAPPIAKFFGLDFFDTQAVKFFDDLTNKIVSDRKLLNKSHTEEKGNKRTDFIQLMLDSENTDIEFGNDSREGKMDANEKTPKTMVTLSADELTAQGILFFIAGYDTTSAALSHCVHYLAQNKECQQKLFDELQTVTEFTYDNLSRLKYLNAVIDETLRLAPSLLRVQRQCIQDTEVGNTGIKIQAGSSVEVLPYALHRDPDLWTDPLEFKPERFIEPTHHPYAYMPFGGGPRLCIGQRFALNEMRMCCAKLFNKFEFTLTPDSQLEYFKGNILLSPKELLVTIKSKK